MSIKRVGKIFSGVLVTGTLLCLFLEIFLGFPLPLERRGGGAPSGFGLGIRLGTESGVGTGSGMISGIKSDTDSQTSAFFGQGSFTEKDFQEMAEQRMRGVHLVESAKGKRDWEFFSLQAQGYEGKGVWELEEVRVLFYGSMGVHFTVTGKKGFMDTKTKNMKIQQDVVIVSSNGYTFNTSEVEYVSEKRKLFTHFPIAVLGPSVVASASKPGSSHRPTPSGAKMNISRLSIKALSMESFIDEYSMNLHGDVETVKPLSRDRHILVKSGEAYLSGKSNRVKFSNQVNISIDALHLQGPEASFEYSDEGNVFHFVEVRGGVKIWDPLKQARAQRVQFNGEDNTVVLSGNPSLTQRGDEVFGDRIVLFDGGRRIRVDNMRANVKNGNGME